MAGTIVNTITNKRKNYWINGALDFWQRGTSFSSTGGSYSTDRLRLGGGGGDEGTFSFDRTLINTLTDLSQLPPGIQFSGRWNQTVGPSNNGIFPSTRIEDVRTLNGKTITVSYFAKRLTGSPVLTNLVNSASIAGGVRQNFGSGGSSSVEITPSADIVMDGAVDQWVRYSFTVDIPVIDNKTIGANSHLEITPLRFDGTTGTFDYEFTGFMVNEGSNAAPFQRAGREIEEELSMCQRYYEKSYDVDTIPGTSIGAGRVFMVSNNNTELDRTFTFKTSKRATPTMTDFNVSGITGGVVSFVNQGQSGFGLNNATAGASQNASFHWTADAEL